MTDDIVDGRSAVAAAAAAALAVDVDVADADVIVDHYLGGQLNNYEQ